MKLLIWGNSSSCRQSVRYVLSQNAGTLTYHVGGEVYVLDHDHSVGFVKGEMCSPGIAAQSEDLMAAGAGGYPGTPIGDVVITDGAFPI